MGACVKDKGNYDYDRVDAPDWDDNVKISYNVPMGSDVEIDPNVKHTDETNPETYIYEWFEKLNTQTTKLLTEQTGPTLKLTNVQGYGQYLVRITVESTGVKYLFSKTFTVNVLNTRGRGFVYLLQNGADVDIEMMSEPTSGWQETFLHTPNMLSSQSGNEAVYKNRTATQIVALNNSNLMNNVPAGTFYLVTDQGCDMLSQTTFAYVSGFKPAFASYSVYTNDGGYPTKVLPGMYATNGFYGAPAMLWNGNWFWGKYQASDPLPFSNAVNILQDEASYALPRGKEIAVTEKAVNIPRANMLVMWSEAEKKFLVKTGQSGNNAKVRLASLWLHDGVAVADQSMTVGGTADFKVEVAGRELIYMGNRGNANTRDFYAVVNDPVDGYQVLLFNAPTAGNAVNKSLVCKFPAGSDIENAKYFACGADYLYYATDSKVYSLLLRTTPMVEDLTTTAKDMNGDATTLIPAGETIVAMKIFANEKEGTNDRLRALNIITRNASLSCTHTAWLPNTTDASLKMATYNALPFDPETNKPVQVPDPTPADPEKTKDKMVPTPMQFKGLGNVVSFTLDDL